MLGVFSALEVAASGLSAERVRMNTIASNLANARSTHTEEGGPYRRLDPVFEAVPISRAADTRGVYLARVQRLAEDQKPPQRVYEPGHPDADGQGYVSFPNVNVVEEMVNMITASRAYEAGVTSIESIKAMAQTAIGAGQMTALYLNPAVAPLPLQPPRIDGGLQPPGEPDRTHAAPFADWLGEALANYQTHEVSATRAGEAFAAGRLDDIHGTMIALKEADIELRVLSNVRNKMVDAFNELMRINV